MLLQVKYLIKRFDYLFDKKHNSQSYFEPPLEFHEIHYYKDFKKWVTLDLEYIDNWSFLLDFKIAVKTVSTVLSGSGM